MSTAVACPSMLIYEITLPGFDGSSDDTDDKVLWIAAMSSSVVQEAIKGSGATFHGEVEDAYLCDADFVLPGAQTELLLKLQEANSAN